MIGLRRNGSLGRQFKEEMLRGNARALVGKTLVVRLVEDNTVRIEVLDEKERVLIKGPQVKLDVGAKATFTELHMLFDVKIE